MEKLIKNCKILGAIFTTMISFAGGVMAVPDKVVTETTTQAYVEYVGVKENIKTEIKEAVKYAEKQTGVPYELIMAVIEVESDFNQYAYNKGCYGLMQISSVNFSDYGITKPYDIENNIIGGAKILKDCLVHNSYDYHKALIEYNCGYSSARQQFANGTTTSTYSRKVIKAMEKY